MCLQSIKVRSLTRQIDGQRGFWIGMIRKLSGSSWLMIYCICIGYALSTIKTSMLDLD
jgi:hypothetical protein